MTHASTVCLALVALAVCTGNADARGASHSSGVHAVHSYVRPSSAQFRIHNVKLPHSASHKAITSTPFIAPHYTPSTPNTTTWAGITVSNNLGVVNGVSRSHTVTSKGTVTDKTTLTGTNAKLTESVTTTATGTVTTKESITAAAPKATTTSTPKASTAKASSGKAGKAPKEAKPAKDTVGKPVTGKAHVLGDSLAAPVSVYSAPSEITTSPLQGPKIGDAPEITAALKSQSSEQRYRGEMCRTLSTHDQQRACLTYH